MTVIIAGKPLPHPPSPPVVATSKYDPVAAERLHEQRQAIQYFFKTWCGAEASHD